MKPADLAALIANAQAVATIPGDRLVELLIYHDGQEILVNVPPAVGYVLIAIPDPVALDLQNVDRH